MLCWRQYLLTENSGSAHGTLTTSNRTEMEAGRIKLLKINNLNGMSYLVKFEQKHRF